MISVETTPALGGNGMNADLDALATRLYVTIDDLLKGPYAMNLGGIRV